MSSISISQPRQATTLAGQPVRLRADAFLFDFAICLFTSITLTIFIFFHLAIAIVIAGRDIALNEGVDPVLHVVSIMLALSYFIAFEALYGATPGKLALGMHVVKANGERCDLRAAVVRALRLLVDTSLFGIPAFLSMRPPLYQRIGDRAAKTVVVSRNESPASSPSFWRVLIAAVIYLAIATLLMVIVLITSFRII